MTDSLTFNQMLINFIDFQGRYAAILWVSSKQSEISRQDKQDLRTESHAVHRTLRQLCRAFGIPERPWMGNGWVELVRSIPSELLIKEAS